MAQALFEPVRERARAEQVLQVAIAVVVHGHGWVLPCRSVARPYLRREVARSQLWYFVVSLTTVGALQRP